MLCLTFVRDFPKGFIRLSPKVCVFRQKTPHVAQVLYEQANVGAFIIRHRRRIIRRRVVINREGLNLLYELFPVIMLIFVSAFVIFCTQTAEADLYIIFFRKPFVLVKSIGERLVDCSPDVKKDVWAINQMVAIDLVKPVI